MEANRLSGCYPEMRAHTGQCYYADCTHLHEPECRVRQAVEAGEIAAERYESYSDIYRELRDQKRYR